MPIRVPQNLLVTGGAGFIGSAFIRYLSALESFKGKLVNLDALTYAGNLANIPHPDPQHYSFVRGSILDQELVEKLCDTHHIDTIVNFAAESHVDRSILGPAAFVETNISGVFSLLEVSRKRKSIHFHQVSTDEVYGSLGKTGQFTERTPYDPRSPYSASKASADHLVRAYAHTYGLSTTISNCSNNYGPYQFPEKLIPLMVLNCIEHKPLPVYGDGSNVRDWLYVDDHVEAIWTVLQHGRSRESYNIGGACERTNLDLLHALIEVVADEVGETTSSLEALITFVTDRPGHDQRYAIDFSKAHEELGWSPRFNFSTGLRDTVRWILRNPQWVAAVRSGEYREWIDSNYKRR